MRQEKKSAGWSGSEHPEDRPTLIRVSERTWTVFLLGVLVALVLLTWVVQSVPL